MSLAQPEVRTHERTLDLAYLAHIERGDRVRVGQVEDATGELFERTLALVREDDSPPARAPRAGRDRTLYAPDNPDLRAIYRLAEAVGGYDAFHDLVNVHSPAIELARRLGSRAATAALSADDLRMLRAQQAAIHEALTHAHDYLREVALDELDNGDLRQLQELILVASERTQELIRILGTHYMHEVERIVARLHDLDLETGRVEYTVDGIFLVNSEVMFIPGNELIDMVSTLFEGIGNPHLARHIDGVLLLAARNLLIRVVSFYSYYGKHQIYNVLSRGAGNISPQAVTGRIRREIRRLFEACRKDNKLVLTRLMTDAEREFELSVEAIEAEAEASAVEAVRHFIPLPTPAPVARPGLWRRLAHWFTRG